jgi:predicted RNA-binding Zn ribbon-like protein
METGAYVEQMRLDGGDPALDYVNTLGGPPGGPAAAHDEYLRGYADLAVFAHRAELVDEDSLDGLLRQARRSPEEAEAAYRRGLDLRALLDDVFRPIVAGRGPAPEALDELREAERDALAHASLEPGAGSYRWAWRTDQGLELPLWIVTNAAVELLMSGPLERLSTCAGCRWLFLDESKNRSRRWCSMAECGTATKKRRYVERRRARRAARARSRRR